MKKGELTQERLKELLDYNPDTGVLIWKYHKESMLNSSRICKIWNARFYGKVCGYINKEGYRRIGIDGKLYQAHRLAWFYVTGKWPTAQIDHPNHIRDDNRWKNLREVNHQENQKNRSLSKNNTSGTNGVCWHKALNKWLASIWNNNKQIHLGCFNDLSEAVAVRKQAEIKYSYHINHGLHNH